MDKVVQIPSKGKAEDRTVLTKLVREMPLDVVLNIVGTALAERQNLDGMAMQQFQRKINDIVWPLVTVDMDDHTRMIEDELDVSEYIEKLDLGE